jgi:hypothetical protein
MASRRQVEEPLIFQGEVQQDVSGADAKRKEKKKDPFRNYADGEEYRQNPESPDASTEQGQETASPIDQKRLESRVPKSLFQQNAQRFRRADQKPKRAGVVSGDKLLMRHRWSEPGMDSS